MINSSSIDFTKISPPRFEELCFKLIYRLGYVKVRWRQGGADSGRDIEAVKYEHNPIVGIYEEVWFFEAKHYSGGVPPIEFESKFAWANAKKPQHLVFLLTTHITNSGDNYFEERRAGLEYHTHLVQGNELKEVLIKHPDLVREFQLTSSHIDFINLIKEDWIIKSEIPHWNRVVTALQLSDFRLLTVQEKLFLASAMIMHFDINSRENHLGGKDEELFMDHLHLIIEEASNEYILNGGTGEDFNDNIWDRIEWVEERNFGALEKSDNEEDFWQFGLINIVNFDGLIGIIGVVSAWKDNKQVIQPFFIFKDTSLTLIRFNTIENNIEEFIQTYEIKRPKEKEREGPFPFDFFKITTVTEEE